MYQLESYDDLGRRLTFPLVKVMTTIGRDPDSDIVLSDEDVSRNHAKIYLMGGAVKIKDENSVNKTFVNNRPIEEMVDLNLGAELIIGSNQFFLRKTDEVGVEDLKLTTILSIDQVRDMTRIYEAPDENLLKKEELGQTVVADKQDLMGNIYLKKINFAVYPALEVIYGPEKGMKYLLPYGMHRLGRGEAANIRINDTMVSSLHGTIEVTEAEVSYTDEGSRNGTILNNKIVTAHLLHHGDVLMLGNTKMKFTYPEEARREKVAAYQPADGKVSAPWLAQYGVWLGVGVAGAGLVVVLLFLLLGK